MDGIGVPGVEVSEGAFHGKTCDTGRLSSFWIAFTGVC